MYSLKDFVSVTIMGLAAAYIGFCVYFDYKLNADPDRKLKEQAERFLEQENVRLQSEKDENGRGAPSPPPNGNKFLYEMQMGEANIICGKIDEGVRHLANAVLLCDKKVRFLQRMQTVLDEDVFAHLMMIVEDEREANPRLFAEFDLFDKSMESDACEPYEVLEKFSHNIDPLDNYY